VGPPPPPCPFCPLAGHVMRVCANVRVCVCVCVCVCVYCHIHLLSMVLFPTLLPSPSPHIHHTVMTVTPVRSPPSLASPCFGSLAGGADGNLDLFHPHVACHNRVKMTPCGWRPLGSVRCMPFLGVWGAPPAAGGFLARRDLFS